MHALSILGRAIVCAAFVAGCGGGAPNAKTPASVCKPKSIPVGHWSGEWESYPMSNPDHVRSGSIDLVISEGGKFNGQTEEETRDTGALSGTAKPGGEFEGEYTVTRDGAAKKYGIKGTFACDSGGLAGLGSVIWSGEQRGNLKFQLYPAR